MAIAETITFEGLPNGQIINTQFAGQGLTISAVNGGTGPDIAVIFDSSLNGTADPDLQGPAANTWNSGNLAAATFLGNMLIIQENSAGIGDGIADNPDDENEGGTLYLDFSTPITSLGFDIVDIEVEFAEVANTSISFERNGVQVGSFTAAQLAALDASLTPGNNSANRVLPITAAQLGVPDFDRVIFQTNASFAIDNLTFTLVPEAGSMSLMAIGACTLLGYGFRRASRRANPVAIV